MKAELTAENKKKFFALYWGQEVYFSDTDNVLNVIHSVYHCAEHGTLFLIPLDLITDEDAAIVAKMELTRIYDQDYVQAGRSVLKMLSRGLLTINTITGDYLRSKGYATSWMGLSVDEMVAAGWIKLCNEVELKGLQNIAE